MNPVLVFGVTLLAAGGVLYYWLLRHRLEKPVLAVLLIFCAASTWLFSNEGRWMEIYPRDPVYQAHAGNQPHHAYFHWHEVYHYYLGGKYFPELGYRGLYLAIVLADAESADPQLHVNALRSLDIPTTSVPIAQAQQMAQAEIRPHFSDTRWAQFKKDLEQMKSFAGNGWLDTAVFDAGYNPPPTWAVIGYTVANLVPIAQEQAWFDGRPGWYQAEFLPLFDLALLGALLFFICRAFGLVPLTAFILLYTLSEVASLHWISGGFFRFIWFAALGIGLCLLREKKWFWAGLCLGIATMDRIFPALFAIGACIPLLVNYLENPAEKKPLMHTLAGFAAAATAMFLLSLALFGIDAWVQFFGKIMAHNQLYFVHHIGYKRVAVFDTWVPNQNFWWEQGLARFALWNQRLINSWNSQLYYQLPFMLALVLAAFIAAWKISVEESMLLFGGMVLFLFAIPANYYYIYFPLVAVTLMAQSPGRPRDLLVGGVFALWIYLRIVPTFSPDELVQNYYTCSGFLAYFVVWAGVRAFTGAPMRMRAKTLLRQWQRRVPR